jgi:hypothetical protein
MHQSDPTPLPPPIFERTPSLFCFFRSCSFITSLYIYIGFSPTLHLQCRRLTDHVFREGFFGFFLFFTCRPSNATVSEDAGIEPRTVAVATTALAVRRSRGSLLNKITKPLKIFRICLLTDILFFVGRHFSTESLPICPGSTPIGCRTYAFLIGPQNILLPRLLQRRPVVF